MALSFSLSIEIQATPQAIYEAWLDSEKHSDMTDGAYATASTQVGVAFTAYDGYITGKNLDLVQYTKIVQAWRTTAFAADQQDSRLEITLEEENGITLLTLTHSNLADGDGQYRQGWIDYYFEPMTAYFADL